MAYTEQSLIELATFLARSWSGNRDITVDISEKVGTRTRIAENRIILYPIKKRVGDDFARYRQFRMDLWHEAMKVRFCQKIFSKDHAFGFIMDMLEESRTEALGRRMWQGMDSEIIFSYTYRFLSRPPLGTTYGRTRILEVFYQHFMFGAFRGEVQANHFQKALKATRVAKRAVEKALDEDHQTVWMEKKAGEIIRILDIDALQTVPVSLPFVRHDTPVNQDDITRFLKAVMNNKEGDFGKIDKDAVLRGELASDEYRTVIEEADKNRRSDVPSLAGSIRVPSTSDIDESPIYDIDLINKLKTRFRLWKSGYAETLHSAGDEFDIESYIDGNKPFVTDVRRTIKSRVVILLDHSSSISGDALEYKKATLGLCEVLSYLDVRFAVYAFSTQGREVVCWLIKNGQSRWRRTHAKRLAQVVANGSTPLAQVYQKMLPDLQAQLPDIFLTLTDGEPSDSGAVRDIIKTIRAQGIRMVALGLGPNTARATVIASNLRHLGYERTLATSRLQDIPRKVLSILER